MARKRPKDEDDDDTPKKKKKGKKAAPRDEDEDDLRDELEEEPLEDDEPLEDEEPTPRKKGPRDDAYTGLLGITAVAFLAACVLLYLDASALTATPVQAPSISIPALGELPRSTTTQPARP